MLLLILVSLVSPPLGVKILNITSTSMTISWQPPHDPNGIITSYQVSYTPHGKEECLHNVVGDTTSIELTSLKPHTEYTIRVRAKTVDFGYYSSPFTASTLKDGESTYHFSIIRDIKSFSLRKLVIYTGFEGNGGGVKSKGTRDMINTVVLYLAFFRMALHLCC